jgi:non-specific serine/threonine protein kinase
MVDWSYDLCTAQEQRAWSVLSVFEGGFVLEAAEHVCAGVLPADTDGAPAPVFDVVAALVDKSVLLTEDHDGQIRYRMLETIRAYGLDRLAAAGTGAGARRRHRDWFVALAVQAGERWFGPHQARWVARLHAERANLRASMQLSLDQGEPELALRLAAAAWFYWLGWGSLEQGRRWLSAALAADTERRDVELRVRALFHLATLGAIHGDAEGACDALLRAGGEAAQGSGLRVRAHGLRAAALAAALEGDYERCVELYGRVLGDPVVAADEPEATTFDLEVLVTVLLVLRRGAQALAGALRGLRICIEHGDAWHRGYLLALYGTALWLQGSHAEARKAGHESLVLARSLDHAFGALTAIELLAWVSTSTGDAERAAVLFGALPALWRSIGAPPTGSGHVPLYHETCRARLVDELGPAAYRQAVRRGERLSLATATAFCLGESARPAKRPVPARTGHGGLTRRELEIAALVAQGMTNQEIARSLVISPRTAEGHVQHILDKLGFGSRSKIAAWVADPRA